MNPEKAIKILNILAGDHLTPVDPQSQKAIKLGIEALKRHRDKDKLTYNGMLQPLPGETEE